MQNKKNSQDQAKTLEALQASVHRLEKDKLMLEISLDTITEHSDLIESQLIDIKNSLEQKVSERTKQLSSKNNLLKQEVAERRRMEQALRSSEERHRQILSCAGEGIFGLDKQGKHIFINPAAARLFGYTEAELLGQRGHDLWHHSHADGTPYDIKDSNILNACHEGKALRADHEVFWRKDGTCFPVEYVSTPLTENGQQIGVVVTFNDITERKRIQAQLEHEALHDALTGLPNRVLFLRRLEDCLERTKKDAQEGFGVLFMDLDRFKVVNDGLGHMAGDQLLIDISQRLQSILSPEDTLARFGGDEFTLLLDGVLEIQQAIQKTEQIQRALSKPFSLRGEKIFTSFSIGIALSSPHYQRPENILRDADIAMYRAKAQGKSCYAIFDNRMHTQALATLHLETDLRHALERQELRVFYQPIISLASGNIHGFEALLRWQHPQHGLLSPHAFVALAEETSLILPIGHWILEQACRQIKIWQQEFSHLGKLSISVNLSAKQFSQGNLFQQVKQVLQETGLPGTHLKLEITESILLHNTEAVSDTLMRLKNMGVTACIDDFGTGYSSLSYLHRLPFDTLKIDRSFVTGICQDNSHLEIVRTIMLLAKNLNMTVIAEGVESMAQANQLNALECDYVQGYLYSKPLSVEATSNLLRIFDYNAIVEGE